MGSPWLPPSRKMNRSRSSRSWLVLYAGWPTKSSSDAPRRPGSRLSQSAKNCRVRSQVVDLAQPAGRHRPERSSGVSCPRFAGLGSITRSRRGGRLRRSLHQACLRSRRPAAGRALAYRTFRRRPRLLGKDPTAATVSPSRGQSHTASSSRISGSRRWPAPGCIGQGGHVVHWSAVHSCNCSASEYSW
jgi:hypothetical protein